MQEKKYGLGIFGVISGVIGGCLYYEGNRLNNDVEKQFKTLWESGTTNPGDPYIFFGIAFFVLGVILIFANIFRNAHLSNNTDNSDSDKTDITETKNNSYWICPKCANKVAYTCSVCPQCGYVVNPNEVKRFNNIENNFPVEKNKTIQKFCTNCGSKITGNGKFCGNCGEKIE